VKLCYGTLRSWVRLSVILFMVFGVLASLPVAGVCYLKIGYVQLVCPLGFTEICLASRRFYWNLFPAFLAVLVLVLLGGRLFCSWACPTSFLADQTMKASRKVLPQRWLDAIGTWWSKLASRGPQLGFGDAMALLAGALTGILLFGYPFLSVICPVGVVTRNIISLFAHFILRYDLILLFLPLALGLLFARGWKSCCPVGNLRGLVAGANQTLIPQVDETACNGCGTCSAVCPFSLGPNHHSLDTKLCVKCFECLDACPQKAIRLAPWG
jgi:ferredoxin-type protein NapH